MKAIGSERASLLKVLLVVVVAMLAACLLALVASEEPAEAAFPGQNGKIVFQSYRGGPAGEIYTMNADGSDQTNISNSVADDSSALWSPNGNKIAFVARDHWDIYTVNPDGSNPTRLTDTPGFDLDPAWSPVGNKIAFASNRDGDDAEICVMDADGSDQTCLTKNYENDVTPAWSPSGTKIAFVSYPLDDGTPKQIYTMNADSSDQTNISNNAADDDLPAWSLDGTKIAFTSIRDGNAEIYTMNADGSNQTNISNHRRGDGDPDWQPLPPNTAPSITSLRPPPGSTTTDRTPIIAATITDQQTDLAKSNITLLIDDETIPRTAFSYNRDTDRMIYTPADDLSLGKHALKVIARDGTGLSTTKRWSFQIVSP